MNGTYQNQARTRLTTAVITIVVIAGIILLIDYLKHRPDDDVPGRAASSSMVGSSSSAGSNSSSTPSASAYKDGTYTADGQYYVPHGFEDIKVTLTVKNNTVTDSQIVNSESNYTSAQFQENFASEYKSYVVGKKLTDINLSYVAGASDTTNGFDDALNQIRQQAQA